MKLFLLFTLFFCFSSFLNHKSNISFYKKIGGKKYDAAVDLINTGKGNIILVGRTDSYSQDMNVNVMKLDEKGNLIWDRTFGGNEDEEATEVIETKDGGFLIAGYSDSYSKNLNENDIWLLKINENGEKEWEKALQTPEIIDEAHGVIETKEGDFLVVGNTTAVAGGKTDAIVLKFSKKGELIWQKVFKGEKSQQANHIISNAKGYAIVGSAEVQKKRWDMWLFTIDNQGNMLWQQTHGGGDNEMGNTVVQTKDGSYVLAGFTYTFAEGSLDAWVIKTDDKGNKVWDKSFGGLSTDEAFDVIITKEDNLLIAGYSDIYVPDKNFNNIGKDGNDVFIACLDQSGNELWKDTFGGKGTQRAYAIIEKPDGYIIAGLTDEDEEQATDHLVVKIGKPK